MDHIKDILEKRMRQNGISQGVSTAQVIRSAELLVGKIIGELVRQNIRSVHFAHGILTFRISRPVIGQEIKMHEYDILSRLRKDFPSYTFKTIRVLQR